MTNPSFNADDPRLTAFVLGEIDDADRAEIEHLLETSPEARAFVDDLQDTIGVLRDELGFEPASSLTDDQRAALQHAAESSGPDTAMVSSRSGSISSRRSLLAGVTATIVTLGIVVAVLPQLSNQQAFESLAPSSQVAMKSADDSSFANASGGVVMRAEEESEAVYDTSREVAQLAEIVAPEGRSRSSADGSASAMRSISTGAPSQREAASPSLDALAGDAGKTTLQLTQEKPSAASQPFPVTVTDAPQSEPAGKRAGFAQLNSEKSQQTKRPASNEGRSSAAAFGSGLTKRDRKSASPVPGDESKVGNGQLSGGTSVVYQGAGAPASERQVGQRLAGRAATTSLASGLPAAPAVVETAPASGAGGYPGVAIGSGRRVVGEALVESAAVAPVRVGRGLGQRVEEVREQKQRVILNKDPYFVPPVKDKLGPGVSGLVYRSGNETYEPIVENEFVVPDPRDENKRLSTISVDVDTASYANVRRFLMQDRLPPPNAVRIEELVNYFKYDYPQPEGDEPFSVTTELMLCPWQPGNRLARIGLQAKTIDKSQRPPTNLVFLLDVSGSMRPANKLPLVQQAMRLLVEEMTEDDQIAIVTYASNAGLRLVSTPGSKKSEILESIDSLTAGGSTNGEGGIKLAYDTAIRHYIQDGSNRVILCTDGDFNVGVSNDNELVELIQEKAASGVFLSVFGFGMGNLKDGKLEKLADKGNGQYGYIDSLQEARRAFKEGLVGTLYTVAKDVKLQAEFNPATVGAYRLIGYENRKLAAADFTDDTKDAGEIGAGHQVTALYEIVPRQVLIDRLKNRELRYRDAVGLSAEAPKVDGFSNELFFVRLRYKQPDQESSKPIEDDFPVNDIEISGKQFSAVSLDFQWAAAVASFGMNLRNSQYRGNWDLRKVHAAVVDRAESDDDGRRKEFVDLVQRTLRITGQAIEPGDGGGEVKPRPVELPAKEARIKASVDGKYRRLLKKIEVRDDVSQYGAFHDYGYWDQSTEYKGHADLLPGHWVYVYPHWYIWGEVDASRVPTGDSGSEKEADPAEKPAEPQLPATPKAVR